MKLFKQKWVYLMSVGLILGLIFTILQWGQYRWMMVENRFEIYAILVAIVFTLIGVWAGNQLMKKKTVIVERVVEKEVKVESPTEFDKESLMQNTGISERELDVLLLMVGGASNQEIADQLFLSLSTVKTHISSIFFKLEVNRRTQAIQKVKEFGLV